MLASEGRPHMRRSGTVEAVNVIQQSTMVTTLSTSTNSQDNSVARRGHSSRKATSYYNQFQTSCSPSDDAPPAYASIRATGAPLCSGRPQKREVLPSYTCTVEAREHVLLKVESENPLCEAVDGEWKEVVAVLRGTLLSLYRAKDSRPGKLLRSYTLQHAEVGLASDAQHTILVPKSRIAHFIPAAARRKAWRTDPDLFSVVRQTILRLRVETDQLLLAHSDEATIHSLIQRLSMGIDISPAIDERSIPKQCTVPRRRRRTRHTRTQIEDLSDPSLLAEQERILRDSFPTFANRPTDQPTIVGDIEAQETQDSPPPSPMLEEDEIDLSAMQEEVEIPLESFETNVASGSDAEGPPLRPTHTRRTTSTSFGSNIDAQMMYVTSAANINAAGKWQPPHNRSAEQAERYARRCMPVLAGDAPRASDIVICAGRRAKINWRMEVLEDWVLQPPSYKAHKFDDAKVGAALTRTKSQSSASASVSATSEDMAITSAAARSDDVGSVGLGLTKYTTVSKAHTQSAVSSTPTKRNRSDDRRYDPSVQGVVFCF